jgi:hypothetical protein
MFKSIISTATDFAERIGIFQKFEKKEEPTEKVDVPKIIEEQPIKVENSPIQKVNEFIEEVKEPIEEVEQQTIVEGFEKDQEYDSDDEVVIHKQIYRTFTVKAPYNGPSQIVLIKVHQNGQYIGTQMNSIEDYGSDEEESQFKVIYNIIVES